VSYDYDYASTTPTACHIISNLIFNYIDSTQGKGVPSILAQLTSDMPDSCPSFLRRHPHQPFWDVKIETSVLPISPDGNNIFIGFAIWLYAVKTELKGKYYKTKLDDLYKIILV
jgi:hypothetical protein